MFISNLFVPYVTTPVLIVSALNLNVEKIKLFLIKGGVKLVHSNEKEKNGCKIF